jgi:hypothetical protein
MRRVVRRRSALEKLKELKSYNVTKEEPFNASTLQRFNASTLQPFNFVTFLTF